MIQIPPQLQTRLDNMAIAGQIYLQNSSRNGGIFVDRLLQKPRDCVIGSSIMIGSQTSSIILFGFSTLNGARNVFSRYQEIFLFSMHYVSMIVNILECFVGAFLFVV